MSYEVENERLRWIISYLLADIPRDDGNQPGSCYQCCAGCGPSSWEAAVDEIAEARWELCDDQSDNDAVMALVEAIGGTP